MASAPMERLVPAVRRPRPVPTRPASGSAKTRYHAIDALRGMAMFLVIGVHAGLGYLERDIPGVLWCVRDSPTLPAFDWFCWWSMGVANPLYFTIAGFFALGLYESRGPRGFLSNRAKRVLSPFLVGVVTLLPACLVAWVYGWLVSGRCTWRQALRLKFSDPTLQAERFGACHLWFLEYLLVMLLAFGAAAWLGRRWGLDRPPVGKLMDAVLASPWRPLFLALPTTVLLWASRHRLNVDAALDRHNSFFINPVKLSYYAAFFAVGVGLYRLRHDLDRLRRAGPLYLLLSVPVFVGRAWLIGRDLSTPLQGAEAWALAALGALFAWLAVFGFTGTAFRLFTRSRPAILYAADSSYWIYLVHMPIVGLIQADLYRVPGHALWKFPVVVTVTLAIGFASYQVMVRHTVVGIWLDGRRDRPAGQGIG